MSTIDHAKQQPQEKSDVKPSKWLDAYHDPVASLYTFTQCITLSDIQADGDWKLIIADLGSGSTNMKLKVYKGTDLISENTIIDLPTGVVTFYMDTHEPRTPAIAVASGPFIYIYKNLRPYFKFTLPPLEVNSVEEDLWNQVREGRINVHVLREMLEGMRADGTTLTVRSLRYLQLTDVGDMVQFCDIYKDSPLKRQTVITSLGTLKKSMAEEDAISCLVLGTEDKSIYVLDPEAFTVLATMNLPSVPVFLSVTGLFDVEYRIVVACRNGCIYTLKRGMEDPTKGCIELSSQIVGMERLNKTIYVASMDQTLRCFTSKGILHECAVLIGCIAQADCEKLNSRARGNTSLHNQRERWNPSEQHSHGKKMWTVKLPKSITTIEVVDYKPKGFKAVLVALANNEVHVYKEKYLVDIIKTEDTVTAMRFGRFGREDGALIMCTSSGGLLIKILKRTAVFEERDLSGGPPAAQNIKLNVPKKTKLFVDQTLRERENAVTMHRTFQRDLYLLRLNTAREYAKALNNAMNPISTDPAEPLKLSAQVQGIGPTFKLTVNLQNTSLSQASTNLHITFDYDDKLYNFRKTYIPVPMLVPGLNYSFETYIECMNDKGVSDTVKVYVLKDNKSVPIITGVISMPVSETLVVV